jgi:signal transduction histidine kinase
MTSATLAQRGEPNLAAILQTYNDVTERLKRSHEALHTEVARLHDELHEKNRELQRRERLAALGEMAAGLAHEIRNPLGGIGLYASLLEKDLTDRPREHGIAHRISRGVQNLEKIVRDILSFAGDSEPKFAEVRLGTIIEGALAQVSAQAQARRITMQADSRMSEIGLRCDGGQIERALLNLLLNALDAVADGGHIAIRMEHAATDTVGVAIEDNGPGIDAEHLHRIFNPFFTTKDHGTGLGLAIVHRIAEAHGGSITARNRRERGACFVLTLPARAAAQEL